MTAIKTNIIHSLFKKEISIAPLIIFRIIFGALMLFGTSRFLFKGWVYENYILPKHHFGYLGFEWVDKLPGNWMYLPFILMLITSVCVMLGAFYRISSLLLFLSFTYVELIDKTYYLNHYYFVSLVLFLLIFLPAHKRFALDLKIFKRNPVQTVSAININIIKFQLGCVYFFAGIAKLEIDWLFNAQPLDIWLDGFQSLPVIGKILASDLTAYAFAWFGCFYDLFIFFFLINKRTIKYAYFFVVVFHLVTWLLFPIGVFPWVMIFSTLIFFSSDFHEKILSTLSKFFKTKNMTFAKQSKGFSFGFKSYFFMIYIFIQLLIPFRYLLYPGNLFWTEEGFRFSWRVMLMHKEGLASFYVENPETGNSIAIDNLDFLTESQEKQMATQPDFLIQYGKLLHEVYNDTTLVFGNEKITLHNPIIRADVKVSLNGRLNQQFVTKKHNFANLEYNLSHRNWIEPFKK